MEKPAPTSRSAHHTSEQSSSHNNTTFARERIGNTSTDRIDDFGSPSTSCTDALMKEIRLPPHPHHLDLPGNALAEHSQPQAYQTTTSEQKHSFTAYQYPTTAFDGDPSGAGIELTLEALEDYHPSAELSASIEQQGAESNLITRSRSAESTLSEQHLLKGSAPVKLTAHSSLTDLLRISNSTSFTGEEKLSKGSSPKSKQHQHHPSHQYQQQQSIVGATGISKSENIGRQQIQKRELQTVGTPSVRVGKVVGKAPSPPKQTQSHPSSFAPSSSKISSSKMTSNASKPSPTIKLSPNRPGALRYKSKTTGSVSSGSGFDLNYPSPAIGQYEYPIDSRRGSEPSPRHVYQPNDAPSGTEGSSIIGTTVSPFSPAPTLPVASSSQYGNPFDDPAIVNTFISKASSAPAPLPLKPVKSFPSKSTDGVLGESSTSIAAATEAKMLRHHRKTVSSPIQFNAQKELSTMPRQSLHAFDPLLNNGTKDLSLYDKIVGANGAPTQSSPGSRPTTAATATTAATMSTAPDSVVSEHLSFIAAELSSLKPRKNTEQEEQQLAQENHRITLGDLPKESTGTAKSHRVSKSTRNSLNVEEMEVIISSINEKADGNEATPTKRGLHRKSSSVGATSSMMNLFKAGGSDKKDREKGLSIRSPGTPIRLTRSKSKGSPNKKRDGNESPAKDNTPASGRQKLFGRRSGTSSTSPEKFQRRNSRPGNLNIMTNASLASSISPSQTMSPEIKMRSSEQEPDPHQMNLPQINDVLFQARLCHLLESYRSVDMNFDFAGLIGMTRDEMNSFLERGQTGPSPPMATSTQTTLLATPKPPPLKSKSFSGPRQQILMDAHKPIISRFMSCSDDIVLEGFFHETEAESDRKQRSPSFVDTSKDKNTMDRMEVAIFKSDYNRQFIVVCQGSAELQAKPIKKITGVVGSNLSKRKEAEDNFTPESSSMKDTNVAVFPAFMKLYDSKFSDLEDQLIQKLDQLAEEHPFFDVIVTGHSFGGVLAQLASLRYACLRPNLFVSCYNFGCPKIGALNYRYYVHSIPNLKVIRMEYGCDPWINEPSQPVWEHAGHCIVIDSSLNKAGKSANDSTAGTTARAYKFGASRPADTASSNKFIRGLSRQGSKAGSKQERQTDHEISSYIGALERMVKTRAPWPMDFEGVGGISVSGSNQEKLLMV